MINLILCGGSGTRLWPVSRTLLPKQFVPLFNGESLFQKTVQRNQPFCERFVIVSNQEQYFLALDQMQALNLTHTPQFVLEPVGRNTAPAIALACLSLDPEELVFVTPSDHLIKQQNAYEAAVTEAAALARQNQLVTFGIQPGYAETGFGYIEADGHEVRSFKEKPSQETAESYLQQGNYFWNSGMFCFKAGVFLEELKTHAPEMYDACVTAYEQSEKGDFLRIPLAAMLAIPENSIDYAVMEHSDQVKVVPSDIGWSDVGSFESLSEELPTDADGNTQVDNSILLNAQNNLIIGDQRLIALLDVEDLMVIDTDDALLIAPKGSGQKIKRVVEELKAQGSELPMIHQTAHRPWGTYTVLESEDKYKIKRIVVKPGKRLSLQKHLHRSEHWVVVSGTATVTVGEKTQLVRPNESTYIPIGEVHRLENNGQLDLVLIEAQVGEYTGEDDIIRFEDSYGRT
ncbi:mannose-1-phosphate guanylyltransferase/mannose-6-phosphate isomerase [Thiomicrorhabdus sp. zzn3]|uniref:mannose-1-phosphate guanylyltransferase/mannose-6-phosphate isomerase n=1 Tax=Thiomicrorhabdus sp. zzn3 TaxID=3039775 RepID=UPI0024368A42|nr:mannose-1-phosphate guanylyltransferase/mannose-6-phosphate isomerase [Thiomicrorhabdus sp. zzn3]MDG6778565.1 mannose-1-phosphate guanylyltransferase/mannose-6-phosphate isomerase [Thiomicrorhabdus sp. zzn3]